MLDIDTQAQIKDIQETFKISEEEATKLVETHDAFVEVLGSLDNPKGAAMIAVTTAVAIASHSGMQPVDFIRMVKDVILTISYNPQSDSVGEA
tara:strand:+ start:1894 stop:2172 length:279 start_codon:yes stop_codon:yes gene_type:complete